MPWDIEEVEAKLNSAFEHNSELELLSVLKENSFLFYELYGRKGGICPAFHEVDFGSKLRCDFAWLNDNSDGPEWVLVEIEAPKIRIFNKDNTPTKELNKAVDQVTSWRRYFSVNPAEKRRIFGAVATFRYVLVAGDSTLWGTEDALKWRTDFNQNNSLEIRSSGVFYRALQAIKDKPTDFWSFEDNPITLPYTQLEAYWRSYGYMDKMRAIYS